MIVLSSPFYLIALLLIPLIWWLHKFQSGGRSIIVSSLLYWQSDKQAMNLAAKGKKSHPLWLLRALITLLLVLALTDPFWFQERVSKIDVWVDDSLSMSTQEQGRSRKILAIDAIIKALKGIAHYHVEIHSLSKQNYPVLVITSQRKGDWHTEFSKWYKINSEMDQLPSVNLFSVGSEHWLVTDSADQQLLEWASNMPFSEVVSLGKSTENSALIRFSMRLGLLGNKTWHGLVKIQHFGEKQNQRVVELLVGGALVKQWSVKLNPQEVHFINFKIDLEGHEKQRLIIRFKKSDALSADDEMSLDFEPLIAVKILGNCSQSLKRAIQSQPSLIIAKKPEDVTVLTIICSDQVVDVPEPSIQFHLASQYEPMDTSPVWRANAGSLARLYLQQQWLSYGVNDKKNNDEALLVFSEKVLVSWSVSKATAIDCYLNMDDVNFIHRSEYPIFIAGLIGQVLPQQALNNIHLVERDPAQSYVNPLTLLSFDHQKIEKNYAKKTDLSPMLIVFLFFLFILDYVISGKQMAVQRRS